MQSESVVEHRLADPRFRAALERLIVARASSGGDAEAAAAVERVASLRAVLAQRRRGRARVGRTTAPLGAAAPPGAAAPAPAGAIASRPRVREQARPEPPPPVSSPLGGSAALHNLQLVQGASFELLLAIQRTLQQEVAALSTQIADARLVPPAAAAAPDLAAVEEDRSRPPMERVAAALTPHDRQRPGALGTCVVCIEEEVGAVLYQCGHMCTCARCAHALLGRRAKCPICRAPIRDVVRAFIACAPGTGAAAVGVEA